MDFSNKKDFNRTDRILVFIATYNEAGNVHLLLNKIWVQNPNIDVLAVDDNSTDNTGKLLDDIASVNSKLKIIHRPRKLGLGTAHHLAMIFAIQNQYDVLVTMDADHSHDPKDIRKLVEKLDTYDFVIGSRYMAGGGCDYTGYRKFLGFMANTAARSLLRIPLHEFTTSFRAFRVSSLTKVNFRKMHNQGYSFFMESVYRLSQAGLKVGEVPIYFYHRNAGESKIPRLEIMRGILKLLHLVISKCLGLKMPEPSPLIEDRCANCHSGYLSEFYARQSHAFDHSNSFRCSSMSHHSKPFLAKCLSCGLIQVPLKEHPQDLEALYSDVVDDHYLKNITAKRKTFAKAYRSIKPHMPYPGNLLEVGSYCGLFLSEANKHGWDTLGIEPSKWAYNHAKSTLGYDVMNGNLETIVPTLNKQFDVVVSWDVLEHVRDPKNYLKTINSVMRQGGTIAISTLDINSWFPRLVGKHWPWIMDMHLFYFNSEVLRDIFKQAGFEMLEVKPYSHFASLRYIYQKICMSLPKPIRYFLLMPIKLIPNVVIPVTSYSRKWCMTK